MVYQTKEILSPLFDGGFARSKHGDKINQLDGNLIYSRNTYNSILEKCCTFVSYCKEHYGVRYLNEIKPEYFAAFIQSGNEGEGYNKNTIIAYTSAVRKLQNGYNSKHKAECIWISPILTPIPRSTARNKKQMPRTMHDKIIDKAYESKYENGLAFDVARSLGLRVSEIPNLRMKDFRFDMNGQLKSVYIHCSKGGRHRTIYTSQLSDRQRQTAVKVYDYFKTHKDINDRLFINKSGSYQRSLERSRNDISDGYKYCGIHSMRKEFAKDYFSREVRKGRKQIEIKKELTQLLGHNRIDVLRHYLN